MNLALPLRSLAIAALAVTSLVLPVGLAPANAAPPGPPVVRDLATGIETLEQATLLSASDLHASVDRLGHTGSSGLALDARAARGWSLDDGSTLIRVPFAAVSGVRMESALTIHASSDGTENSMELVLTDEGPETGHVETWVNGEKQVDQVVHSSDRTPDKATKGAKWDKFNACLNRMAVPAWVVTGISIACGALCATTIGTGCLVCMGAAAAAFSATISYCATLANL